MKLWIPIAVVALGAGVGYSIYSRKSLTASDEFLPNNVMPTDKEPEAAPVKPAGKPGPPADPSKLYTWLDDSTWSGGTENGVELVGSVGVYNIGEIPVHNMIAEISLTYTDDSALKKTFLLPLKDVQGAIATSSQGVLFPGHRATSKQFRFFLPAEYWRRDKWVTVRIMDAEHFDDRSNLKEPMQLCAFIREAPLDKIREAFEKDPELKEVKSAQKRGPMQFALQQPDPERVKLMESLGFDVGEVTGFNECAYHFGVFGGPKIIDYLATKKVKTTVSSYYDRTPAHYAVFQGLAEVFPALKRAGISLDAQMATGATPLILAAESADMDLARAILKAGARKDLFRKDGVGFMGVFVDKGRADLLEEAIKMGGSLKETNPNGDTLLHLAVRNGGGTSAAVWLLRHGADKNAKNKAGQKPGDLLNLIGHPGDQEYMRQALAADYSQKR